MIDWYEAAVAIVDHKIATYCVNLKILQWVSFRTRGRFGNRGGDSVKIQRTQRF